MSSYEDVYYISTLVAFQEKFLALNKTKNVNHDGYLAKKLDLSNGPVFFENQLKGDVPFYLSHAQLAGIYPIVSQSIASLIKGYDINGFQLFPSIIIDDDGEWHKEFYFFNFYQKLDCVDFENSKVNKYYEKNKEVLQYRLKREVLDAIPEENRLIIELDFVDGGAIIFHEKIVNVLSLFDIEAFQFFKVSEYMQGMEYSKVG